MPARRVLFASAEIAGVASTTRDALRRRGHHAELWTITEHPFLRREDRMIQGYGRRAVAALRAPFRFDVLHMQAGNTLLEYVDLAWARVVPARRPLVLMHYWGDDVRLRLEAGVQRPLGADEAWEAQQRAAETLMRRRLRLASRLGHAAIVSDLELAGHAQRWFETVYLVPTPLGLEDIPSTPAVRRPGPVRILHAPSHQLVKGTSTILAAIDRVAACHDVEPVLLSGVPRSKVLERLADADLVVDQLGSQTTGVLALESMAVGRPVLVQYERELLAPFARDTPAVAVTADTVEQRIEELVGDAERRAELGRAGREFVTRTHDADVVAATLEQVYAHARRAGPGLFDATPDGVRPLTS